MVNQTQRIEWIDIYKGISITFVVAGHVLSSGDKYIFWFHMPLFFFISGFLYKPEGAIGKFFKKKVYHLLIPYFSFLFLLSAPDYIVLFKSNAKLRDFFSFTIKQVYGGRDIYGWFDVFWFVTCLFLIQQAFHLISRSSENKKLLIPLMVLCLFIYATICQYLPQFRLPLFWGINIVPMAILFFYFGHIINEENLNRKTVLALSIVVFILFMILDMKGVVNHELKMKWESYGIPILNVLLAISGIILVFNCAKLLSHIKIVKTIFVGLGKACLVIMFLHQAVRQIVFARLPFISNEWIIIVVTLIICCCAYFILSFNTLLRIVFLGEVKKN